MVPPAESKANGLLEGPARMAGPLGNRFVWVYGDLLAAFRDLEDSSSLLLHRLRRGLFGLCVMPQRVRIDPCGTIDVRRRKIRNR